MDENRELYLELNDEEWPFEYDDHDREIVRAIAVKDGLFYFVRAVRNDEFGNAVLIETSGGGVEKGEDLEHALKRELREELGAESEVICKIGVVSDHYNLIHRHNINNYYLCRLLSFGSKSLTEDEAESFHLSTLELSYEEAVREYEYRRSTRIGRLIANRELPILKRAKEILDRMEEERVSSATPDTVLETERLTLRPWRESDAEALFLAASDPYVGPPAGWPPHQSTDESLMIIKNILSVNGCFAICLKGTDTPIGSIQLRFASITDMTDKEDECELGYWLARPYWGKGIMPEAAEEILRYGFEELGMTRIWCGYYEGNERSRHVQRKLGFEYKYTTEGLSVPQMHETRTGHTNSLTREQWEKRHRTGEKAE